MEFRCDRCATRYSTTQAVRGSQAYTYRCRLCGYTIFVRAGKPPAETPPPRAAGPADPARAGPAGGLAGSAPRREAGLASIPADLLGGRSVIGPGDLPPPSDGYIDLTLDDDPPPRRPPAADAGPRPAITLPSLTPVPVPAPAPVRRGPTAAAPLQLPRPRASLRPADGPNRAARGELTPTAPIPLARRLRGLEALLGRRGRGRDRGPLKVTRRQRLLVAAAVFPVVTAAAMALGVAFAARSPEPAPSQRAVPAATAAAAPPRPAPPPVTPPPPQAAPPAPARVPALPDLAAVRDPRRAASSLPARGDAPAPREPARAAPRTAGTARAPRVASAPAPRPADPAGAPLAAAAGPGARAPASEPRASAAPPPRREEDPVAPRPGFRPPAPLPPHCVEDAIRLPASWADRPPGSVILRFAVGRDGAADLVQLQPGPDRLPGERVEPDLAQALRAAVRGCRFVPGLDDRGHAVRMWVVMKVRFAG